METKKRIFSEEHRRKISEYRKGKKMSQELKDKLSLIHKLRYEKNPDLKERIRRKAIENLLNPVIKENHMRNTKRGIEHGMYGKVSAFYGKEHTEETKLKMSEKQSGENHPLYGKHHSIESKKKSSDSCKKWWNSEEGIKARLKQSQKMKEGLSSYANSLVKNISKPQLETFEIIKEKFDSAKINYPFFNYSLDITIPDYRIVIEYDGSYWHQDIEYDKRRQKYLENHGWKFIRYRDHIPSKEEILNDIEQLIKGICNV